jgi:protein-tyrosine phosphatase
MNNASSTSPLVPFADSYWVIPGRFLAGGYPGTYEEDETRRKLIRLLQSGINAVVDLTEKDQHLPYQPYMNEEASSLGQEIQYFRMAIKDFSTPTANEMINTLNAIDQFLIAGRCVYLHCYGGIGRTGMVVGCFLVRHGMDGKAALQRLADLRQWIPNVKISPETDDQKNFVLNWRQGK